MRSFGNDAPEFFSFRIGTDKKVYKVPLAASMPYSVLKKMQKAKGEAGFDVQVETLRQYIGDIVDELDAITLSNILNAWAEESHKQGAEVGES
jgi:hypothetical protein